MQSVISALLTACLLTLGCSAAVGQPVAATQPADGTEAGHPAGPAVAKAQAPGPANDQAAVDDILNRLETKGQAIKGLQSKLVYRFIRTVPVKDTQTKSGELLYASVKPNALFLIHFDTMIAESDRIQRHEYWLFDGEWLTERNDKARTVIKRQVVRKGQAAQPFRVGKGPFPLPFGQKREDILTNFKVELVPPASGDPANTHHLRCTPLEGTEYAEKYSMVDFYIEKTIELPVRIVTEGLQDKTRTEVDFQDLDASAAPAMSKFKLDEPAGFDVRVEPLPLGKPK